MKTVRILIFLLVLAPFVQGLELNFKLSGGFVFSRMKEINRTLENWAEIQKREAEGNVNWNYLDENVKKLDMGVNLEGEIILFFTQRFAVGLGGGTMYSDLTEEEILVSIEKPGGVFHYVRPTTATLYPLTLSGYIFFPLKNRLNLFIKGGAGLAWAKLISREASKKTSLINYNYSQFQRSSASGSVFVGSVGLIYETEAGIRFFIEGQTQLTKIQGFTGIDQEGNTGTLFYFEEFNPDYDFWQAQMVLLPEKPSGDNFRSVSEASVDFSGFSAKIGFMIRF
jgi:hypothetical protein